METTNLPPLKVTPSYPALTLMPPYRISHPTVAPPYPIFGNNNNNTVRSSNSTVIEVVRQTDGGTGAIGFAWYAACVAFFCGLCHVPTGKYHNHNHNQHMP